MNNKIELNKFLKKICPALKDEGKGVVINFLNKTSSMDNKLFNEIDTNFFKDDDYILVRYNKRSNIIYSEDFLIYNKKTKKGLKFINGLMGFTFKMLNYDEITTDIDNELAREILEKYKGEK